tara:strand:- start:1389 stop:2531 length:1143 start_codon:yes stop_codon:yes gene_type:complete
VNVYFDNAATTPLRARVIDSINDCMKNHYGNSSSSHSYGRDNKSLLENARKSIASFINANENEIVFTSGGSESNNSILRSCVRDLGVKTIISSPIEHNAVLNVLDLLETEGVNIKYVKLDKHGEVDLSDLEQILKSHQGVKLVSLMHINNEIGNLLDIDEVARICKLHNSFFHTDSVQAMGHYKIDLSFTPIDFLSASAHKFHGPKGIGFSFIRNGVNLNPFIIGGPQERGLRAGTEAVDRIVGMQRALEISYENHDSEKKHIQGLKKYFIEKLKSFFPEVYFNGHSEKMEKSSFKIVNVAIPINNSKSDLIDFHLDLKGIACSKGSACQSGSSKGSHVIEEFKNKNKILKKYPSLRFSFSFLNTKKEIDYLIESLLELK